MTGPRNAKTTSKGRTYQWRDETFDSVTTILSGGIPKPALTNWAAKSVAEYVVENLAKVSAIAQDDPAAAIDLCKGSPWRQRDKAADVGSTVHQIAELHVLGMPLPDESSLDPAVAPVLVWFEKFLAEWNPTYELSEATVYSRRYGYAGTLDAIFTLPDGRRFLCDYKTGRAIYGEVALQLAAYRYADFIGLPDGSEVEMPEVDGCVALHLTSTGYQLVPVEAGPDELKMFRFAQQVRWFVNDRSRQVLGAPMGLADLGDVLARSIEAAS